MGMAFLYFLPLFAVSGSSKLQLASIFQDYMVLPRAPKQARIWGTASAYSNIMVVFGKCPGSVASQQWTVADANGYWLAELEPQPAGIGYSLIVTGDNSAIVLVDIAFGDIWICSGQSNMVLRLDEDFEGTQALATSDDYINVRYIELYQGLASEPQNDTLPQRKWKHTHSTTSTGFSAACYSFGTNIHDHLGGDVPIGLIAVMWGGKRLELFSSPDALNDDTCGGTEPAVPRSVYLGDTHSGMPSDIWNYMINPLLNLQVTGVLWHHGEAHRNKNSSETYSCRLKAMIKDWRVKFDEPDLAFLVVQVTAHRYFNFAEFRDAQMSAISLPHTSYVTTIDLGESHHENHHPTYFNCHTRRQMEVGRRLALTAMYVSYGAEDRGVGPEAVAVERLVTGQVRVSYAPGTAYTLHAHGTAECQHVPPGSCCNESPFEQTEAPMLPDSIWLRIMNWTIKGETVLLEGVNATAAAIRYAWEGYPQCAVYNGVGGPDNHMGIAGGPFLKIVPAIATPTTSTSTITITVITAAANNDSMQFTTINSSMHQGAALPDYQCSWYNVLAPVEPMLSQEGTCRIYVEALNLPNTVPAGCRSWYGTLEQAMTRCDNDPNCTMLYDFRCDDAYWRYCDYRFDDLSFQPRFTGACTKVVQTVPCSHTTTTTTKTTRTMTTSSTETWTQSTTSNLPEEFDTAPKFGESVILHFFLGLRLLWEL